MSEPSVPETRREVDLSPESRAFLARMMSEYDLAGIPIGLAACARMAIVAAMLAGMRLATAEITGDRFCRVCGCTTLMTCAPDDPCWWVSEDLCSACAPFVAATR